MHSSLDNNINPLYYQFTTLVKEGQSIRKVFEKKRKKTFKNKKQNVQIL